MEIAAASGLTPEHIAAIRSVGCTDTGKSRVTQSGTGKNIASVQALADEAKTALGGYYREFLTVQADTTGWEPTCKCAGAAVQPCRVLDPFGGSGTVALVAAEHGRDCTLIDLVPHNMEIIAVNRLKRVQPRLALEA